MKQFYYVHTQNGQARDIVFEKPVRKICLTSTTDCNVGIKFPDGSVSKNFLVLAKTPLYLDFQSRNNGGGLKTLTFLSTEASGDVYISVCEYGTGGDIDWYK